MKFCWCTVNVNFIEESIKFYTEIIGLQVDRRFMSGSGVEVVFLGDGETQLELIYNEAIKEVNIGQYISLGFEVESVNEKIEYLKSIGVAIHSGPFQPNPHIKFFYVLDPNGLKVQFVENI
ncbi:MAG: VOC family protein [Ruminiclostridium sp.]